uniref:Uncharacterized protein n=1 Tax=Arundo donax TaxID=35708 RepID=A0A0A9EMB6_ARUDO
MGIHDKLILLDQSGTLWLIRSHAILPVPLAFLPWLRDPSLQSDSDTYASASIFFLGQRQLVLL